MVNRPILNSSKRSHKINKAPEKQLKKNEKETQNKQTKQRKKKERLKKKQSNKPKTTIKATLQTIKHNKATNCEMKVNGATLTNKKIH